MKFTLSIAAAMLILGASAIPLDGYGQFVRVSQLKILPPRMSWTNVVLFIQSRTPESVKKNSAVMDGGV